MKDKKSDSNYGKTPPQAVEIEEAILGAILLESGSYLRVAHFLSKPDIFYKECNQKILKAIIQLHNDSIGIDMLTVTDRLKVNNELDIVGGAFYITQLTSRIASANHLEFHCMIITDKSLLRELIRISSEMQERAYTEEDPKEIAEWAEKELVDRFDLSNYDKATFKDALHNTLMDIANKSKGITQTFIKTGDELIDNNLSIREKSICLIAGSEGSGKTKYVTYLIKGIIDHNDNVGVLWFSMEDSKEQIVRSFISMGSQITTKQLQSINYKLTPDDMIKIAEAVDTFKAYSIEFIDHVCSISTITRKCKQFRDKHPETMMLVVIDNLGLITTDSFFKGLEKDDYLAGRIKEITDITEASVFILHHITKESAKRFNIAEGYRPRKEYIKGSTRILDYVQQAIMVNLPRKYKDLVFEEKEKAKMFSVKPRTGKFDKTRFLMEFWTLNPKGDSATKNIADLPDTTWYELRLACQNDTMDDGTPLRVGHIITKYVEYLVDLEDFNRHHEAAFQKAKLSIYSFIINKKYKEDFKPKNDSRTFYLYGNNLELTASIQSLFIVESIKNRDGKDDEETNIMRYMANLDYNIFKPIINEPDKNNII
jgi:replicative DNA helicase